VIVTVISVGMMQMVADQVVHVIAMRDGLMRAVGTMGVVLVVRSTHMVWRASVRIGRFNLEHVFVYMIEVRMMQMAIMQIVGMSGVRDGYVTTRRMMLVIVVLMFRTGAHCDLLLVCDGGPIQFNSTP